MCIILKNLLVKQQYYNFGVVIQTKEVHNDVIIHCDAILCIHSNVIIHCDVIMNVPSNVVTHCCATMVHP